MLDHEGRCEPTTPKVCASKLSTKSCQLFRTCTRRGEGTAVRLTPPAKFYVQLPFWETQPKFVLLPFASLCLSFRSYNKAYSDVTVHVEYDFIRIRESGLHLQRWRRPQRQQAKEKRRLLLQRSLCVVGPSPEVSLLEVRGISSSVSQLVQESVEVGQ